MAHESPSPSVETTASLLRASGLADLSHAADLARALLAMGVLKAECERLGEENRQLRADRDQCQRLWVLAEEHVSTLAKAARDTTGVEDERAYQRCHADLLSLVSILTAYPLNASLQPDDWQQVKAIAARWTEGG